MNKDLEYILNFDENLLFNTKLDDECTNKKACRESIRKTKERFKEFLKERETVTPICRAFDFCGIKYTNTPHQGLAKILETALKKAEYLWFLEYAAEQLRRVEHEND